MACNLFSGKKYYIPKNPLPGYENVKDQVNDWLQKFQGDSVKVSYAGINGKIRVFVEKSKGIVVQKDF